MANSLSTPVPGQRVVSLDHRTIGIVRSVGTDFFVVRTKDDAVYLQREAIFTVVDTCVTLVCSGAQLANYLVVPAAGRSQGHGSAAMRAEIESP
ncbi:hypothetical protein AYO38_05880 [bacterium SCGC AG-212-C10]|nr:hypothetical protein AYO38_05880 [bacterium SCGC AG-212-C10]